VSEPFISNARARVDDVRIKVERISATPSRAEVLALCVLAEALIIAVDSDGTLPASLCTAVVRYGRGGK